MKDVDKKFYTNTAKMLTDINRRSFFKLVGVVLVIPSVGIAAGLKPKKYRIPTEDEINAMSFDELVALALAKNIDPEYEMWLDDEWPAREDDLRDRIMEIFDKENEK